MTREIVKESDTVFDTKDQIDNSLYDFPEHVELEPRDGLIGNFGVEANDLLDTKTVTKQEEEDFVLEQRKKDYNFDEIKDAFDEEAVPESVYFFYGGESENFTREIEFLVPNADNREFAAFLLSDLGRTVMTSNKISIHLETEDIFYENYSTGENFYNFLMAQQNEQAVAIPKKFSYRNTFEAYIGKFLPAFSIDDIEKSNLYTHKNAKYLFYCFNDYVKAYSSHRRKIKHTLKLKDSVGMQKLKRK